MSDKCLKCLLKQKEIHCLKRQVFQLRCLNDGLSKLAESLGMTIREMAKGRATPQHPNQEQP